MWLPAPAHLPLPHFPPAVPVVPSRPATCLHSTTAPIPLGCIPHTGCPRNQSSMLKACERRFRPLRPLTRYCSEEYREKARRWREWKARHHYRQSEGGKQKRRAQSRRYRLRSKRTRAATQGPRRPREGHRKKKYFATPAIGLAAMKSSSRDDVAPAAILFALLSPSPGASSRARTTLAGTPTRAGMEISARHTSGHYSRQVRLRWS